MNKRQKLRYLRYYIISDLYGVKIWDIEHVSTAELRSMVMFENIAVQSTDKMDLQVISERMME